MQTERVTFLTTPDHKAALDAFATSNGMSVGHVVREATSRYIAQQANEEADLAVLVAQANEAMPIMAATLDKMIETLEATNAKVAARLREASICS